MPVTLKRQIRRLRESGRFVAEAFDVKHRAVPAVIRPGDTC